MFRNGLPTSLFTVNFNSFITTLKSLIEEHARLDFSDFLFFHVINEKFHPAHLVIDLLSK